MAGKLEHIADIDQHNNTVIIYNLLQSIVLEINIMANKEAKTS